MVYLQSQYWPLVWGSAGLLRPDLDSSKVVVIDHYCPARTNTLEFDSEISAYYFFQYPTTPISQVAYVEGYGQFYQVVVNDFG